MTISTVQVIALHQYEELNDANDLMQLL